MMLEKLKHFFGTAVVNNHSQENPDREHDVIVAVCALLLEIGRIDDTFTQQELEQVLTILKEKYGLSGEHADALITEADRELEESVDLWQFARVINKNYRPDEKEELIERLWQIVYVDGKMDKYEDYLMNKLSHLLLLSHKQLIDAKLRVLHP